MKKENSGIVGTVVFLTIIIGLLVVVVKYAERIDKWVMPDSADPSFGTVFALAMAFVVLILFFCHWAKSIKRQIQRPKTPAQIHSSKFTVFWNRRRQKLQRRQV